jgi:hypothetical protein
MSRGLRIAASVGIAIVAFVYGVSPVDLLPEMILGPLGYIDDAAAWVGAGFAIWKILKGGRGPKLGPQKSQPRQQGVGDTDPFNQV